MITLPRDENEVIVMPLSEWPEHLRDKPEPRGRIVNAKFEAGEMLVKVVTDKAVGLSEDEASEVTVWIPISQIHGKAPAKGSWIEGIEIPQWLAEDKNLEF